MREIVSPLDGLRSPFPARRAFSPVSIFTQNEPGLVYDAADVANLSWQKNFAVGSADVKNVTYWPATITSNGVTATKLGAGTDTDGLPYVDYSIVGTATNTSFCDLYAIGPARIPALMGQTFTTSTFAQITSGTVPPAGCGAVVAVFEETAPTTQVGATASSQFASTIQGLVTVTYTLVNAAGNQARGGMYIRTASGATVNYTVRVKGLQFERGSVRTSYQPITDLNTELRDRFAACAMFQDANGTVPVSTPGQIVRLAYDESRRLELGPELITNGNLSSGLTGWTQLLGTVTATGGRLRTAQSGGLGGRASSVPMTCVVGRVYRVSLEAYTGNVNVADGYVSISATSSAGNIFAFSRTTDGPFSFSFVATQTTHWLHLQCSTGTDGSFTEWDNISVRELYGTHANQTGVSTLCPIYGIRPASGLRNRANGSADIGNTTFWPLSISQANVLATKVGAGFDIDGLPYVDVRYQGTASGTFHDQIYTSSQSRVAAVSGNSFTTSFVARVIGGSLTGVTGIRAVAVEETAPSTFVTSVGGAQVAASTDTVTSGTITIATGNQARGAVLLTFTNGATIDVTYRIKGLQLEAGSTRTAYQFNYSQYNTVEAPFASRHYLRFDGIDDFLVTTTSIDPTSGSTAVGAELFGGSFITSVAGGTATATESPAGTLNITGDGTNQARGDFSIPTVAGKAYVITVNCANSAASYVLGTTQGGNTINPGTLINVGANRIVFTAISSTTWVRFFKTSATLSTLSGVSAREATGKPDSVQVFAGVRKLSDAARGIVVELATGANGTFGLNAPVSAAPNYQWSSQGTALANPVASPFAAPDTAVITGLGDISGDSAILRRNGTQVASSTADQGTGNYSTAQIWIGRRGGTSLPANIELHTLVVRFGPNLPTNLILNTEDWTNKRIN